MTTQIRKDGDPRLYTPDRDLAWIGLDLIRKALDCLDRGTYQQIPVMARFYESAGLTPQKLNEAGGAIGDYLKRIPGEYGHALDAVAGSDLERADPAALALVHWQLGRLLVPLIFAGIRDATVQDLGSDAFQIQPLLDDIARRDLGLPPALGQDVVRLFGELLPEDRVAVIHLAKTVHEKRQAGLLKSQRALERRQERLANPPWWKRLFDTLLPSGPTKGG